MFDINNTTITGRLGKDAEIKTVNSADGSKTVINMRIARSRGRGDSQVTDWFSVTYWPKTEKEASFLKEQLLKGTLVLLQGEFRNRTYRDSEEREVTVTELHAWDIQPESKPKADATSTSAPAPAATASTNESPAPAASSEPPLPSRTNGHAAPSSKPIF